MSTIERPKQFIDVLGVGRSLLQLTFDRFKGICPAENVWIVTNKDYAELCKEQLPEIPENSFAKKLYSTYLSYLPKEKTIFPLKMNADDRGSFTEIMKSEKCGRGEVRGRSFFCNAADCRHGHGQHGRVETRG